MIALMPNCCLNLFIYLMINTYVWKMLLCACLFVALLRWWQKQEMQWGMALVPGHQGKLGRQSALDEVKSPPFRPQSYFDIIYLVCQLGLLPERTRRASFFKMQLKTQTCLQQRRNGFCLKHCWVILVFQCQLSWLLPVWGREDREVNQQRQDGASTGTSISVPEVWGRKSSL